MNGEPTKQQQQVPPAYALQRSDALEAKGGVGSAAGSSMDYSADSVTLDGDSSFVAASSVTAGVFTYKDATATVQEMHLALLYLLSNPDEFNRAIQHSPPRGATTLAEWNAEYDNESNDGTTLTDFTTGGTPLPYVVFADDAEVVLPQAHTASQLFGIERIEGIELEAAAGVPALSQLFLRWLALMPGGDHLNIIDPPGLTIMRIAGGRYRVTAAHRVVWTWMNEFAHIVEDEEDLTVGDLVTMTIVDVFETDNNGKLLSYCPTFDNRKVLKTNAASEKLRKSSASFLSRVSTAAKSETASKVNRGLSHLRQASVKAAVSVAASVKEQITKNASPQKQRHLGVDEFEQGLEQAAAATQVVKGEEKQHASEEEDNKEPVSASL